MNVENFEKTPGSILSDITQKPKEPEIPKPADPSLKGSATLEDILKGNANTKIPISSISDTATGQPIQTIGQNNIAVGELLESKMAIELMDALLPGLFVAMFYAMNVKLRKTELQLTEKEKGVIAPVMQKCLNTIMLNFDSPWTLLAVTLGVIYGSKITEKGVVSWIDKLNEKKEIEALEEKTGFRKPSPVVPVKQEVKNKEVFKNVQNVASAISSPNNPNITHYTKAHESISVESKIHEALGDNAPLTSVTPYPEGEIRAVMNSKKMGRDRAIKFLNTKYLGRKKRVSR